MAVYKISKTIPVCISSCKDEDSVVNTRNRLRSVWVFMRNGNDTNAIRGWYAPCASKT